MILPDGRAADWLHAVHDDLRALLAPFETYAFPASADPAPRHTRTTR
jgi:hypothetical protein